MLVLLLQSRKHLPKQKKISMPWPMRMRWSDQTPIGSHGTTPGLFIAWSPWIWAGPTLCGSPVGNKINTTNLYAVKLISKHWGSPVGVEVVGGTIKSRHFRFMLVLIWVTVKPMFCQYFLLIFAPGWRKDAQAQHKCEGGTESYETRKNSPWNKIISRA